MATTFPAAPSRTLPSDQDASGRTLGTAEIDAVSASLRSGTLTSTKGTFVSELESRFAAMLGVKHAFACSSGTAAIHCAIAAIDPEPGDEIITTSITDMGALAPILYQGAIPVFADVDPLTCNVTRGDDRRADQQPDEGDRRHPPLRQSVRHRGYRRARQPSRHPGDRGLRAGVPGVLRRAASSARSARSGCFSLQQGKHITTGEGGLVVTNDDALARRMYLYHQQGMGVRRSRSPTTTSSP